jgi:pyridinium-3,5-bisthiocarboxylic acid mononucleotide nickel chelatase
MHTVRFDSVGGASGDMILGALLDLGVDFAAWEKTLHKLPIESFRIENTPCEDHGTRGRRITVHAPEAHAHAVHRHLADIHAIVARAPLPEPVRDLSLRAFRKLAEAEAEAHHTTPEQVHFHEVGALDSIVDIVGACLALHALQTRHVTVGPLPLGSGTVETAHGRLPVPVPATVALLKGHAVTPTDEPFELVTPTGAVLLTLWQEVFPAASTPCRLLRTGIGFGHRTLHRRPNLLRAALLEAADAAEPSDTVLTLETNVDDTVPELLGTLTETLRERGALDVFTTAIQMKKQRPGARLTVLCRPADREVMLDTIFEGCATFGIREYETRRTLLERHFEKAKTPFGTVRVKIGSRRGRPITRSPEYEDCLRLARQAGVPARAVYEEALQAAFASTAPAPTPDSDS